MDLAVKKQNNALNTIRLLAAIEVMWGHMVYHLHISMPEIGGVPFENIVSRILSFFPGVPIFFFLSGYLLWFSVNKENDAKVYFFKRFRRIYPELWCGVLISVITIIIFWHKYIRWGLLAVFAVTQSTVLQFWTPDFLRGYGCGTPNGSLWTMCITVQFYITVWIFRKILVRRGKLFWISILTGSILWGCLTGYIEKMFPEIVYKLYCVTLLPYVWMFLLGMFVAQFSSYLIPFFSKWWLTFFVVLFAFKVVGFDFYVGSYPLFCTLLSVLGCLGLAYAIPEINVKFDISYPIYIYHMIFVNVVIALGMPWYLGMIFTIIMTLLFSIFSTVFIGNRIMIYKK